MSMGTDRIIITRYRTGSHSLRIQTGSSNDEQRNVRLSRCGQTVDHVLFSCRHTENTRRLHNYGKNTRRLHNYGKPDLTNFFKNINYNKMAEIIKSVDEEASK